MKSPRQKIVSAIKQTWREMRLSLYVPNIKTRYVTSTGNLALNALRYRIVGNIVDIYIDESVAPYVVYTNEPWTAKRWKGKPNPNEGWWERFCQEFARRLARKLRGKVERGKAA